MENDSAGENTDYPIDNDSAGENTDYPADSSQSTESVPSEPQDNHRRMSDDERALREMLGMNEENTDGIPEDNGSDNTDFAEDEDTDDSSDTEGLPELDDAGQSTEGFTEDS